MCQRVLTFIVCCLAATEFVSVSSSIEFNGDSLALKENNGSQCKSSVALSSESDKHIDKQQMNPDLYSNVALNENSTKMTVLLALSASVLAVLIVITVIGTINDQKDENGNNKASKLRSFSLRRNIRSLLSVDQKNSPNDVLCLHGMRTLCTFSIIYLHSYFYRVLAPVGQKNIYSEWGKTEVASRISSLNITVDTFFVISALLLTKSMLKDLDR